jgi:uncharacterized protein YfaS (alpha-2-macroglobulin family)
MGQLDPGVYVMTAKPGDDLSNGTDADDESGETVATQWFIVSDLGLTAFSGKDGIHVLVRSLASALPVSGIEVLRATMSSLPRSGRTVSVILNSIEPEGQPQAFLSPRTARAIMASLILAHPHSTLAIAA